MNKKIIIAIDGNAASGKGTLAKVRGKLEIKLCVRQRKLG